jgi:hypothetical protein
MQLAKEIRGVFGRNAFQVRFDLDRFVEDHSFHERSLSWKMRVKCLFAHSQFFGEIVHSDATETVRKKMSSRHGRNSLGNGTAC